MRMQKQLLSLFIFFIHLGAIQLSSMSYAQTPSTQAQQAQSPSTQAQQVPSPSTQSAAIPIKPEKGQNKATSSTSQASQFESSAYQFQIQLPSSNWRLLTAEQAQKISSLALSGAVEGDRILGLVMAEPHRNLDLETYAQALLDYSPLSEIVVERVTEIQRLGLSTLRIQYSGDLKTGRFRYITDVFLRDDHAFQITAGGLISQVSTNDLLLFMKMVSLKSGPLNLKQAKPKRVKNQWGVGWLFRDQIFSSFLSGLQIPVDSKWQALVGEGLTPINGDAEFGLHRLDLNLHLLFFHTACPHPDELKCRQWLTQDVVRGFGLETQGEKYEFEVAGRTVPFQIYGNAQGVFKYIHGIYINQGQAVHVLGWTLDQKTQDPDRVDTQIDYRAQWMAVQTVLRQISSLSESQKSALRADYFRAQSRRLDAPLETDLPFFKSSFIFRRNESWIQGQYHNHIARLKWTQPSGIWKVALSNPHDQSSLSLQAPLHSLNAQLSWIHQPNASLKDMHQKSLHILYQDLDLDPNQDLSKQGIRVQTQKSKFAQYPSFRTSFTLPGPYGLTYRLHTTRFQSTFVHLISWSPHPLKHDLILENIESGLSFTHRSPIQLKNHRYEDQRFYFALDLMDQGTLELNPDLGLGTWSTAVTYESNEALIMGFAVGQTQAKGFQRFAQHLAQRVLTSSSIPKVSQRKEVWIQGRKGVKYLWKSPSPTSKKQDLAIYLIPRGPLLYGYLIYASPTHTQFKKGGKALSLLEIE